ncbi:class I SAM-dependent DNA methyltransferase [Streptomyces sp. NRRL S-37]|uniref:class I SAM-dependent DNA methyltransferase n=1 Tax=Streptomyces sp. NRRL S-37 TaxID=1463903 RepID=UPI0004C871B5|nr:class I SAM-dependent methyltransferase [Streptomyces sp. NRRL S-37]
MTTQENYGPTSYGEELADIYDNWIVRLQEDAEPTVRFLADLAERVAKDTGEGRVLELGVGTGRVALPLAARGVDVTGIDASEEMLAQLRGKSGSDAVSLVHGDFVTPDVRGPFGLVYVVFNTLYSLATQEDQIRCLAGAAALLPDGGAFVFQGFVPDTARFEAARHSGQQMEVARTGATSLNLGIARHDPVRQHMYPHYSLKDSDTEREHTVRFRYVWPSELDLMARLAGLTLEHRYADWAGGAFTAESQAHVSVYRKTGPVRP